MNYEEQAITFAKSTTSMVKIPALVAIDTGLACTKLDDETFRVVHVPSGYPLPNVPMDLDEAKRYLENLAKIFKDRWLCDQAAFKRRYHRHQEVIDRKVHEAFEAALSDPDDEVFLYACTKDDAFPESDIDTAVLDPNSEENLRIANELLSDYPEATRVIMTRMDSHGEASRHEDVPEGQCRRWSVGLYDVKPLLYKG